MFEEVAKIRGRHRAYFARDPEDIKRTGSSTLPQPIAEQMTIRAPVQVVGRVRFWDRAASEQKPGTDPAQPWACCSQKTRRAPTALNTSPECSPPPAR